MGSATYPMVSGHEIAGRFTRVGNDVTNFKVGDYAGAGLGCLIPVASAGSARRTRSNIATSEPLTCGSIDHCHNNDVTQGAFSNMIVVSEKFAIKIPKNAQVEKIAPGHRSYSVIVEFGGSS